MPNLVSLASILAEICVFIQTVMAQLSRLVILSKNIYDLGSLPSFFLPVTYIYTR